MPPKTRNQPITDFSLEDAHKHFDSLGNAANSKLNWKNAITTLVTYSESGQNTFETGRTKNELFDLYKNVNIVPLISDFDEVQDIVEHKLLSSVSKQPIAVDSKKQYYNAVIRLTQKRSKFQLNKETKEQYTQALKDTEADSNRKRNENRPKRALLEYPNFTWGDVETELKNYIDEQNFTNTAKGRKALRNAVIVGLYVIMRPRRALDYSILQYYGRKPTETEATGRNIFYKDGGKYYFSLDKFKTRMRLSGSAKEQKELLPRFIKEVNPYLASLMKDLITKWGIKDMSKLSKEERKKKTEYFIFHLEKGNQEQNYGSGFSKYVASCSKAVFNRNNVTPNIYRHLFNTYIADNLNMFNDNQLNDISIEVGDTPRSMASNLRYRHQQQNVAHIEKTQIEGLIRYQKDAADAMNVANEEEGSVGDVANNNENNEADADEIQSPAPANQPDADIEVLYRKLGTAQIEVRTLELIIMRKLGTL